MKTRLKQGMIWLLTAVMIMGVIPIPTMAAQYDLEKNTYIDVKKIPTGKTGQNMSMSLIFNNDSGNDLDKVTIAFDRDAVDSEYNYTEDGEASEYAGSKFPFEVTSTTFEERSVGNVKNGNSKTVTFSAKVRRDIAEGYYVVPFEIRINGSTACYDKINIWITKSTAASEPDTKEGTISFSVGQDQTTPYGVYPNVMEFSMNVKNSSNITAQDVTVSMGLSEDSTKFPFDINEANYDRHYDRIGGGETVLPAYSMAIRKDVYSGYYPITFKIEYRDSSEGELQKAEEVFYVHVQNKEKEEDSGEFNANDRTKARIIVESFTTVPEKIMAGDEFDLILRMKNASESVPASNILFTLESEKVTESAVFTMESGSSSVAVNSLGAGNSTEIRVKMLARAGIDQRSYALTINEKYDSPEFKNAEEKASISIPVYQLPRLNTGTIEVMPETINLGSESNIMFPINNMGKVTLFNVMAKFEADFIQAADTYVGNIESGKTGNVDVMLSGTALTAENNKVKIIITYEDENGVETAVEKQLTLNVIEDMGDMGDIDVGNMEEIPMEPESPLEKYKKYLIPAAVVAVAVLAALIIIVKKRKKKKAAEEEGMDDENS